MVAFSPSTGVTRNPGRGRYTYGLGGPADGAYPFINLVKGMTAYRAGTSSYSFPSICNSDMYPQSGPNGSTITGGFPIPSGTASYVIKWTGTFGTLGGGGLASGGTAGVLLQGNSGAFTVTTGESQYVVSKSNGLSLTGTNGRVVFTPTSASTSLTLTFQAQSSTGGASVISGITDVVVCLAAFEDEYDAGYRINPDYISFLQAQNVRAFRFLGWSGGADGINGINHSREALRPGVNCITFSSNFVHKDCWADDLSTSDGVAYTCSNPTSSGPGAYEDGEMVQGFMSSANTSPTATTLNVGGRGAKLVQDMIFSTLTAGAISLSANRICTFIYDISGNGGAGVWLCRQEGMRPHVPVEHLCEVGNRTGKPIWINVPHHFDMPSVAVLAAKVRDNLDAPIEGIFEWANEVWNFGAAFLQTYWANTRATALGYPRNYDDYYGLRTAQMLATAKAVWTDGRCKGIATNNILNASPLSSSVQKDTNLLYRWGGWNCMVDANGYFTTGTATASATGYITGTSLILTSGVSGTIRPGMTVSGSGVSANTKITGFSPTAAAATPSANQLGQYAVNNSQTVGSSGSPIALTFGPGGTGNPIAEDYSAEGNRPQDLLDYISTNAYYNCNLIPYNEGGYEVLQPAKSITAISKASPGVISITDHGFRAGDRLNLSVSGMTQLNGTWITVAAPVNTDDFAISAVTKAPATVTISAASPGVVSWASHGMSNGDMVIFEAQGIFPGTPGALPTGLSMGTIYYVTGASASAFNVESSPGGGAINTSGSSAGLVMASQVLSNDTSSFSTFTSGTASRQAPRANEDLLSYADLYATGTAAQKDQALQWIYDSAYNGARPQTSVASVTISVASPAVVTWSNHGLSNGDRVYFTGSTSALPTGVTNQTYYYVANKTTNAFNIEASPGGGAVNTSGSSSGQILATKLLMADGNLLKFGTDNLPQWELSSELIGKPILPYEGHFEMAYGNGGAVTPFATRVLRLGLPGGTSNKVFNLIYAFKQSIWAKRLQKRFEDTIFAYGNFEAVASLIDFSYSSTLGPSKWAGLPTAAYSSGMSTFAGNEFEAFKQIADCNIGQPYQ